jgi:endonuclease YncB( thermonuclease family)
MKTWRALALALLLLSGFLFAKLFLLQIEQHIPSVNDMTVKVMRVIDGDTIVVEGGKRIRYLGIDTPETVDWRKGVQCFGPEASRLNKELVEGKRVRLERDKSDTDRYNRPLRYVWLGDVLVNEFLIREGYAIENFYGSADKKYRERLHAAEEEARREKRGLWSACTNEEKTNILPEKSKKRSKKKNAVR